MAVRRLHPEQPTDFAFTSENMEWVQKTIAKYPPGKQASAVIPVLWRAQEQIGGWLTEPAIRVTADLLGMAYIRVYEVATFYTMFQLAPVGRKAHVQVCGTTPCMLRGAEDLIGVCKKYIAPNPHQLSSNGDFSWEEVECLGACANAPMVQIFKDTYEDLTADSLEKILDGIERGKPVLPGSQIGRQVSAPEGGATTLQESSLYDGSGIGAWRKRFEEMENQDASSQEAPKPAPPSPPKAAEAKPAINPAAAAATANAGLVKNLEARAQGKPLSPDQMAAIKAKMPDDSDLAKPELLDAPKDGKADDLKLIWGVGPKMEQRLNQIGIFHFEQIASLTPASVDWLEKQIDDAFGSIERDKWVDQAAKLATGWRPENEAGEKPKG